MQFNEAWPLESIVSNERSNFFQPIGDTGGIVFLRYGSSETVESFVQTFNDFVTNATIASDRAVAYAGEKGRQVSLVSVREPLNVYKVDPAFGPSHTQSPELRTKVCVIGFRSNGIPVLVGYLLPEQAWPSYKNVLKRIVGSGSRMGGNRADADATENRSTE